MSKRLNEFYKAVLDSLSIETEATGEASVVNPETGTKEPFLIDGRRVTLPTREFLRMEDASDYQPFHPLSENLARGQSIVIRKLVDQVRKLVVWHFVEISMLFMEVACKREFQTNLPSVWNNFFRETKDADETTLKNFQRVLRAGCEKHVRLASVFLKNGGKLNDKKFNRICHINFSWFDELDTSMVFGVKLRKKDITVIKAVLKQVLPSIDVPNAYSVGVNTDMAPYFTALMSGWAKVARDFNNAIAMASPLEPKAKTIPLEYMEKIDELGKYYRDVPPLEGNEGEHVKLNQGSVKQSTPAQQQDDLPPWDTTPTQKVAAPERKAAPVKPAVGSTADFRNPFGAAPQQPQVPAYPQQQPVYQQQPMYGQPQQFYQQQPMQPVYQQPMPQYQQQAVGFGQSVMNQPSMYQQYQQPVQQVAWNQPQGQVGFGQQMMQHPAQNIGWNQPQQPMNNNYL